MRMEIACEGSVDGVRSVFEDASCCVMGVEGAVDRTEKDHCIKCTSNDDKVNSLIDSSLLS